MNEVTMNIKEILNAMADAEASDCHLIEGNPPSFIINGKLSFHGSSVLTKHNLKQFLDDILDDQSRKERFFVNKELDFAFELEGKARFRFHAYFQRNSIAYSVRMIPLHLPSLEALHLPSELRELCKRKSGFILVVGPAKSGKSMTLAAMVDLINSHTATHIVTIEDPIEYVHRQKKSVISQREVGEDVLSVADALRHILRQSPGIVIVDGIDDKESVRMALEAAETGHLVICSLRAWNVVQSINKLVNHFSDSEKPRIRTQISHSLIALISQRLLQKKDGTGVVCACEVLPVNETLQKIIRDDQWNSILSVLDDMRKQGVVTLNDRFAELYKENIVDLREIEENGPGRQGFADTILLH
jgi:twitching motility protein PilT